MNHSQDLEGHNVADDEPEKDPLEITITEDCDPIESFSVSSEDPSSAKLLASPSGQVFSPVFLSAQQVTKNQLDKSGVLDIISEIVESIIPPFCRIDAHAEAIGEDKQASSVVDGSCSVSSTTLLDSKCDTSSLMVAGSAQ